MGRDETPTAALHGWVIKATCMEIVSNYPSGLDRGFLCIEMGVMTHGGGPCARLEDEHTVVMSWEYMKSQVKIMNLCKCDSIRNNMNPRKT